MALMPQARAFSTAVWGSKYILGLLVGPVAILSKRASWLPGWLSWTCSVSA